MDREQAKFVLGSFRPDGADAADPAFAEALAVAAADRELGHWLAQERATDAAFAAALGTVSIPEDLRDSILAVLAGQRPEFSEFDGVFAGALAAIRPPVGLREEILAAMRVQQMPVMAAKEAPQHARKWRRVAALAATVVLGGWLAVAVTGGSRNARMAEITPVSIERVVIESLRNPLFSHDHEDRDATRLISWLDEHQVPAPAVLPPGLEGVPGIGCKVLKLNDAKAAMICFKLSSGEVVHMVTLDLAEVEGTMPTLSGAKENCHGCKVSGWSSVAWCEGKQAFVLMGRMDPEDLAAVF